MGIKEEILEQIMNEYMRIDKTCSNKKYYFDNYADNLYDGTLSAKHEEEFNRGGGGELKENKKGKHPKMAAIGSSSAMTVNLLGNGDTVTIIKNDCGLPLGEYFLEYEKPLYTIRRGHPANLDAFLRCGSTAIFCEMKMLEWIKRSGNLKKSYLQEENYSLDKNKEPFDVFRCVIELISGTNIEKAKTSEKVVTHGLRASGEYGNYDAWQMFKHVLGIYNYTCISNKEFINNRGLNNKLDSYARKFSEIILLNVVCEPPETIIEPNKHKYQEKIKNFLDKERNGAKKFKEVIEKAGIQKLFKNECGVDKLSIKYLSATEFAKCIKMSDEKKSYLKRYTFD